MRQALLVGGVTTEPLLSPLLSSSQSALEEWRAENNTKLADVRAGIIHVQQHVYQPYSSQLMKMKFSCTVCFQLCFVGLKYF